MGEPEILSRAASDQVLLVGRFLRGFSHNLRSLSPPTFACLRAISFARQRDRSPRFLGQLFMPRNNSAQNRRRQRMSGKGWEFLLYANSGESAIE